MEREEFLEVYRHSLAHILAKAIVEMFGIDQVQYAIGPQIADGFYYDFTLPRTLNKDDFKTIEDKMREITGIADRDLMRSDVSGLTALHLEDCGIRDISALADLRSVQDLFLGGNRITDLSPLGKMAGLKQLYLCGNQHLQ